jgi:hypothetical protein
MVAFEEQCEDPMHRKDFGATAASGLLQQFNGLVPWTYPNLVDEFLKKDVLGLTPDISQ